MKKKIFFISVFLSLGFLFTSCQTSDNDDEPKSPETPITPIEKDALCPTFSPIGGFYKTVQKVEIKCNDAETIYYTILKPTLDSEGKWDETAWIEAVKKSKPTEDSTKYTEPFDISEQCIVRALAVYADGTKKYAMTSFDFDLDRSTDFSGPFAPENPESTGWQDQIIYFILTDRFFNGDTSNDKIEGLTDQSGKLYDERIVLNGQPASGYNGGDIEGVRQKLQYIKDLGFTAIWMTPPVKCQVAESNYHGYHGYWASDFTEVDPHMGTLEQYQNFVKEAHELGLYVIQDIVVNHTGDYQQITQDITDEMIQKNSGNISESDFYLEPNSVPFNHPEQLPWALNNINDLTYDEWKNNAFYHYNTEITDYTDQTNMYTHQSSNLDDITTENPVVRNLLRGYFRYWIDKAGIDGYRIDTALYVEPDFFEGFINDSNPDNMGVRTYGISKGKSDFINFGEAFTSDEKIVGNYTKSSSGAERMDGMIYFPLRNAIADTISSGGKTSGISKILKNRYTQNYYSDPDRLVTFIDNHDIDRWGQTMHGNTELMKAAYGIIYTIPGIPSIYYGSEQGFNGECREGMFKGSYCTPGTVQSEDRFENDGEWYKYFQNINKMRKENRVFRYNTLYTLQDTSDSAGILAYVVREKDENGNILSGVKNKAIFVMNTAPTDKILDASYANLAPGDKFELVPYEGVSVCPASGTQIEKHFVVAQSDSKGNVKLIVPANSCAIYIMTEQGAPAESGQTEITVDEVPSEKITGSSITVKGTSNTAGKIMIVLNGDYSQGVTVDVDADVQFAKEINVKSYSNGKISVQLVQIVNGSYCYSEKKSFTIERPFKLVKQVSDPAGDDNGVGAAKGILQRPTDAQFDGSLDIQGVDVYRSGNDILLGVKMGAISKNWSPSSNLFDHVVFYVFISDGDDSTGCGYHPKSNYELPASFGKWDYMFQCNGWGQAYYSSEGASETSLGKSVTPAPANDPSVDWEHVDLDSVVEQYAKLDWSSYSSSIDDEFKEKPGMIYFKISAATMGYPKDISGYKFYINTWDFDMGSPRGLIEGDATRYRFACGNMNIDKVPLVCDETDDIITID